jgi:2-aminoadipate transaminase
MSSIWNDFFPNNAEEVASAAITALLKVTQQPSIISFAGGLPASECFPVEELAAAAERALVEHPIAALQYGVPEGYAPLRAFVAERMTRLKVPVLPEQVLITSGSQQVLDLIGRLILDPGAPIAVEDPTFLGVVQAWADYSPHYITLPLNDDGLDVDALDELLSRDIHPRFLYLVSCFQNPTGVTLPPERKRALIALAARHNLPILEDDPYSELYYNGVQPPTLAAIDVELHGEPRHVLYMSSFSKLLTPGLRVGWVAGPQALIAKMAQVKQGLDVHTSNLAQATVYEACNAGLLDRHIPSVRATYGERLSAMLAALDRHMPADVSWTRPVGGMFIWMTLPEQLEATALLRVALEEQVAFVPGTPFYAKTIKRNTLRLNFSYPNLAQIETGIARLGRAIRAIL